MSNDIFVFIINRISVVFLLVFVYLFSPRRYKPGKTIFVLALTGVLESCTDAASLVWSNTGSIIVFEIILIQTAALYISKYRDWRALYVGTLASAYVLTGDVICNIVYQKTSLFWLSVLVQVLIHTASLFLQIRLTRRELLAQLEEKSWNWILLLTLPAFFYITLTTLGGPGTATVMVREVNYLSAILLVILMNLTNIVCMRFISVQTRAHKEEKEKLFLETYSNGLKNSVAALQETERKNALMRHDIKHFGEMLYELLNNGETEKAKEAVMHMNGNLPELKPALLCENIPVNAVLSVYKQKAVRAGVDFRCKADVPLTLVNTNEYEYATVIANILDNALRAASEVKDESNRIVNVCIIPVKKMLMLDVSNSFDWDIHISKQMGLPETNQGDTHGFGTKSIQAFAHKNGAMYEYSIKDKMFFVRLSTRT